MKQILLDNAYESWKNAIYNHDKIVQGFVSLKYQKAFVVSLHNAVELFLKQIMLDAGNHDVASLREIKDIKDAQLAERYMQARDLNNFFKSLSETELDNFRTVEFHKLIENHKRIIGSAMEKETLKSELKLIQRLRNNETHFYIDSNNYLKEEEFVMLHNFMIVFFEIALKLKLFPRAILKLSDMTYGLSDEEVAMEFRPPKLSEISFVNALKKNTLYRELVIILQD